ncbi:Zinc finger BED domain-containing protein RICESLEEPER 2 [Glycine max]|nr:Zinc finger BED domain-containing protein RICESLEEPER 2 [Glycine max]
MRGPKKPILKTLQQSSSSVGDRGKYILVVNYTFNQDAARMELTKMIALHEYLLAMVDHTGFRRFCNVVQPLFKVISCNTLKLDILKFYESERAKTMKLIQKNSSRIAITIDTWTASNQDKGYMTITAHFIDNNWNLQSRLMRFMYVPALHTAEVLAEIIIEHFFEWNLDRKYGMSIIHDSIEKIRDNVSFWVGTPKREEKFIEACEQLEIPYSKKLRMNCRTRWNSTYLMFVSALPYFEVLKRLTQREPQYKSLPSDDDWKMATEIFEKLEIFYKVTELFSGTQYPTSNVYFPKVTIQGMTDSMIPKFEKYWGMINGVMAIGVILDPRLKMKLLNYFFPLMYGSENANQLNKVTTLLEDLISKYQSREKRTTSISTSSSIMPGLDNNGGKSELDLYLEELVLFNQSNISNFDILGYWKNIGVKYPTLKRIAKDFLAIPISTDTSESAFSIGGQFLTPHRSKLNEDTVEALMCFQDWLDNEIEGPREEPENGNEAKNIPSQKTESRVRFRNGKRGVPAPRGCHA